MNETTNETTTSTQRKGKAKGPAARRDTFPTFATAEEARAQAPADGKAKLFGVTKPNGTTVLIWATWSRDAVQHVASQDGYSARAVDSKAEAGKVAGLL